MPKQPFSQTMMPSIHSQFRRAALILLAACHFMVLLLLCSLLYLIVSQAVFFPGYLSIPLLLLVAALELLLLLLSNNNLKTFRLNEAGITVSHPLRKAAPQFYSWKTFDGFCTVHEQSESSANEAIWLLIAGKPRFRISSSTYKNYALLKKNLRIKHLGYRDFSIRTTLQLMLSNR